MPKLTKAEIDRLACPDGRRDVLVFDEELPGFGIRLTSAGNKIFIFQYQRLGAVRRLVLGRYGEITPAAARKLATTARGAVTGGADPVAQRQAALEAEAEAAAAARAKAASDSYTVERLIEQWAREGLATRSAAHRREAPRALKHGFGPAALAEPASSLTSAGIQRTLDAIAAQRPVTAQRFRAYGRTMASWAVAREKLASNPFATARVENKAQARDRVLSDAELGAVWRAASSTAYPFGPLVQLAILTLQRRNEVAGMRWSELSPGRDLWTIPSRRAKNRKAHLVHLVEPARAILATIPPRQGSDLVFTLTGQTPASGFSRAVEDLRDAVAGHVTPKGQNGRRPNAKRDAEPWRLHDFRRTGVTCMARLGVPMQVADRILNHIESRGSRSVAEVYQRYEFLPERLAASELWAAHVLKVAAADAGQEGAPARKPQRFRRRPVRKPRQAP